MLRRLIVGIAVGVWLLVIACGSGTGVAVTPGGVTPGAPAATTAPAALPKLGDRAVANGVALTAVKIEQKAELSQFQKAKDGMVFVIVEVLLENTSAEKTPYNLLYFTLKDGDGFEHNPELVAGDGSFQSGELAAGDKVRGNVAFEVKKDAKGLVLQYKPLVLGASEAIRIALN